MLPLISPGPRSDLVRTSRPINPLEVDVVPELLHWDAEDLHVLQVGHEVELLVVAEQHLYCLLSG